MFAVLHSDINSRKSGLLHFTGQPYYKNCRSGKVKDGIINVILRNYLFDRYMGVRDFQGQALLLIVPINKFQRK
jgi:hypothetical protein